MTWHSAHAIEAQQVNVFECKACDKISAVAATIADTSWRSLYADIKNIYADIKNLNVS